MSFFIGASAKKNCIRPQILGYGLPVYFFSKWQKKLKETDMQTDRLPKWFLVLHFAAKKMCIYQTANIYLIEFNYALYIQQDLDPDQHYTDPRHLDIWSGTLERNVQPGFQGGLGWGGDINGRGHTYTSSHSRTLCLVETMKIYNG